MIDSNENILELTSEERVHAKNVLMKQAYQLAMNCSACPLNITRKQVVFGDGDINTKIVFIGEAPGGDEDEQGVPFVGRAGQLLTKILEQVNIKRSEIYITNIIKCRPENNRDPAPEEMLACYHFLQTQILLIDPAIIILLGNTPAQWILKTNERISKIRGKWFDWNGIAVMPIFHPSYLLRFASPKQKEGSPKHLTWLDVQEIKRQWDSVRETGRTTNDIKFG